MKGAARIAILTLCWLGLAGCWNVVPVEDRGLATMLAVDRAWDGTYQVTVAVLHPPGLSPPGPTGQGGGKGAQPVLLRSQPGSSLAEAIQRIQATSYLQLDFTHLQALLVSEDVARTGLGPLLDQLARTPQFSLNGWLVVARGTWARALLEQTQGDLPQPNDVLAKTVRLGRRFTPFYAERISTLLKEMPTAGQAFTTAGVAAGPPSPSRIGTPFELRGLALFRGAQLVGWLDDGAALGWAAGTGKLEHQTMSVASRGWRFDLNLLGARRRVLVQGPSDSPSVLLSVRVTAHLVNFQGPAGERKFTPVLTRRIEQLAAAAMRRDVEAALDEARRAGADIFGLGEYVRLRDPGYWEGARARWDQEGFPRLPVQVQTQVRLTSIGDLLCPPIARWGCGTWPEATPGSSLR